MANPIYLAGYIERAGTGTRDIVAKCKAIGLKDPEFIQEEYFSVILWRKEKRDEPINEGANEGVNILHSTDNKLDEVYTLIGEGVNEGVKETLNILLNVSGLNAMEIADKLNKSDATAERYLRLLREHDIVEFRGAAKSGGYYLTEKANNILKE